MTIHLDLISTLDILLCMQTRFSYIECMQIFSKDTEHYWQKWKESKENIILFLERLDDINKTLLLEWGSGLV